MAIEALLAQAAPYIIQGISAALPYLAQTVANGMGSGSSSNATSQSQQGSSSMSGGESSSQSSIQQGSVGGIASLLGNATSTPTGSNWEQAFTASQGSAQTANNLQNAQWTFAQATNMWSSMMANAGNLWSQTSARSYNRAEAQAQRDWAKMMRGTAYQDTVEDLKAAGLNPILAAHNGATASTSGQSASISPGNFSAMTSAGIPSAHAASAQSMYDYGNNTMQFLNSAMANINNAKQYGFTDLSKQVYQMTSNIMEAAQASTAEYAQETQQIAEKHLQQVLDGKGAMRGGNFTGDGAGRGR